MIVQLSKAWTTESVANAVGGKLYGAPDAWIFLFATVGIGEIISCGVLGLLLHKVLERTNIFNR